MALIGTFTDNFNTGTSPDTGKWTFTNGGTAGTASLNTGQLVLNSGGTTAFNGDCFLDMNTAHDLTGSSAYVKLATPASYAGNIAMNNCGFRLRGGTDPANEFVGFFQSSALEFHCLASRTSGGVFWNATFTFSATDHVWLRIREASGTVYWDTASSSASNPPASGDWTNRTSVPVTGTDALNWAGSGITAIKARLFYQLIATPSVAQEVRFDGFNTGAGAGGATYNDALTEVATTTHSQTVTVGAVAARTETAVISHIQTGLLALPGARTEVATISDSSTSSFAFSHGLTETAAITDTVTGTHFKSGNVTEVMTITHDQRTSSFWEKVDTTQTTVWTPVIT